MTYQKTCRINIFIPSAGLGERLWPVTEHIPKPLIPILGKPILEIVLEKVSALPINRIGINLYHKKEEIKDWIEKSAFRKDIDIFQEDSILGTGGAFKNAEAFLKEGAFLVHNSDIISDIELASIIDIHLSSGNIATLAVRNHPEINNVMVGRNGSVSGIGKSGSTVAKRVTFTGIAVYSPEFLKYLPEGKSSVVDGWLKAISSGLEIGTVDVSGSYWRDIGTPESYLKAVFDAIRKEGETIFIHPTARISGNINPDGYVVIEEGCVLSNGVSLMNTVLMPHTEVKKNSCHEGCIIGQGYEIDVDVFQSKEKILIGTGGSDRNYYRIKKDTGSLILMEAQSNNPDFERHIEYTRFFEKHSIPVPGLIEVNHNEKTALFEDLGDLSLYSWLKCPRREDEKERLYRSVIDILVTLHTEVTEGVSECPLLKERVFDYEHLRWETDYFTERFVKGVRNIDIKNGDVLREEFHSLALKVDSFPKTIVHRDFQSQNIMIQKGRIPRLVDYQGARIGPPAYDLVSILWDPYYRLEDGIKGRLVDYYIDGIKEILGKGFSESNFRDTILPCRLQRHMQALAAYGFLSMVKGKKYFLKYVPEGLRLLKEDVFLAKDEYPEIYKLVSKL